MKKLIAIVVGAVLCVSSVSTAQASSEKIVYGLLGAAVGYVIGSKLSNHNDSRSDDNYRHEQRQRQQQMQMNQDPSIAYFTNDGCPVRRYKQTDWNGSSRVVLVNECRRQN